MKILTIGDICGEIGLVALNKALPELVKAYSPDLIIVNGENADGLGITPVQVERIFAAGAHVITLGNHTFNRSQIAKVLDKDEHVLRPLNFTHYAPGGGYVEVQRCGMTVGVMSLIGRLYMAHNFDNPFFAAQKQLEQSSADLIIADFHAEATSEKIAMAYYLNDIDNRAVALYGTHTHVQTSDERVFANGLGYITDVGMCGAYDSILGMQPKNAMGKYLGQLTERNTAPKSGVTVVEGAVFTINIENKCCMGIERVRVFGEIK